MNITSKTLLIFVLGALSMGAYGAGEHSGGHDMKNDPAMTDRGQAHDMPAIPHGDMHEDARNQAIGRPGDPAKVSRTVEVLMEDRMRFVPDRVEVKPGETIRFFVKNTGRLTHEMVLGTMDELTEHAAQMRKTPGMKHREPGNITLEPGQRGAIVWQFAEAGTVPFACLEPGHMEAGMVGSIEVR